MSEVTTIGLDIAKNVFHAHGADASGQMAFSRRITRGKLLEFFGRQPRCLVALEACGGAHHWARELQAMGHEVRLIPPDQRRRRAQSVEGGYGTTVGETGPEEPGLSTVP